MKKAIFLVAACMCSLITIAQQLTADEMIEKTKCKDFDCFKSFATNKGFGYEKLESKSINRYFMFSGNKGVSVKNLNVKNKVTFLLPDTRKNVMVELTTADKAYYNELYDAFRAKGFKATAMIEKIKDSHLIMEYKYQDMTLILTVEEVAKDGVTWSSFSVQLTRTS